MAHGSMWSLDLATPSSRLATHSASYLGSALNLLSTASCLWAEYRLRTVTPFHTFFEPLTQPSSRIVMRMSQVPSSGILRSMLCTRCPTLSRSSRRHFPVAWPKSSRLVAEQRLLQGLEGNGCVFETDGGDSLVRLN